MNICVFASSSNAVDSEYFNSANLLGKLLAGNNHDLTYGGANVGLMEALASSMKNEGAYITGIIPKKIADKDLSSQICDEMIVTTTMDERKKIMREKADAFIALPGGFGTLEEILEVITLKQLDYHQKPIVFLNTNGLYNALFKHFERSYHEVFARENYRNLYYIAETEEQAIQYIESYQHNDLGTKWFNVPGNV